MNTEGNRGEKSDNDQETCPQCRSERTESAGVLQGHRCKFCGNEWANISQSDVEDTISVGDQIKIPEKLAKPIEVIEINGRTIKLAGNSGATYRLSIQSDATGLLKRKKSASERNQFGSEWTNSNKVEWEVKIANTDTDSNPREQAEKEEEKRDVCPECGSLGELKGESTHGGPSVGVGAPTHFEHWECTSNNCDRKWSA